MDEEARLLALKLSLKQTVDELDAFAHLRVAFSELEHLTYLAFRLGTVPVDKVAPLTEALEKRALVVPLGRPGFLDGHHVEEGPLGARLGDARRGVPRGEVPGRSQGGPRRGAARGAGEPRADRGGPRGHRRPQAGVPRPVGASSSPSIAWQLALDVSIDTVKQGLPPPAAC